MDLVAAGLHEQSFRTQGKSPVFVAYAAQASAFEFLQGIAAHPTGLGLFEGPPLSGKSTIIRAFVESLDEDTAVAVVDGAGINTTSLLSSALSQFGYELQFNTATELANMLRVFSLQQTAAGRPPLLIVENTQAMSPGALRMLCELAEFQTRNRSALRMVLASNRSIETIVRAPATVSIGSRLTASFTLEPMSVDETCEYLLAKLRAGGCSEPQSIIPLDVCYRIHESAEGWPGVVDTLVLLAIARATECPITADHIERLVLPDIRSLEVPEADEVSTETSAEEAPRLILTLNGQTLKDIALDESRLLIGRAEHNDLSIGSR
jgi:type II secretory pathway predicted ATPase ExeA